MCVCVLTENSPEVGAVRTGGLDPGGGTVARAIMMGRRASPVFEEQMLLPPASSGKPSSLGIYNGGERRAGLSVAVPTAPECTFSGDTWL